MKKIAMTGVFLLTAVLLCGCTDTNHTDVDRNQVNTQGTTPQMPESSENQEADIAGTNEADTVLRCVQPSEGSGNQNGYYYLAGEDQTDADGNSYINIRYIDYQTGQDIILCNKPNCQHDNMDCTSYINALWPHDAILIAGDTKLFLICNPYGGVSFSYGGEASVMENAPTIYTMNLDGSDRKKIVSLESGSELQSSESLVKGDKLYLVVSKSEVKTEGDSAYSVRTNQELVEVDNQKKSARTICEFMNQNIVGAWNQSAVIRKCNYEKNPDEMTDSEFQAAVNNLQVNLYTLNLETGETETCFETDYKSTENLAMGDGRIYFGKYKDNVLSCYDLSSKETSVVTENLPAGYISCIIDGKIICNCDDGAALNAKFTDSYSIDAATGEITKRSLVVNKPYMPVRILADAGTDYLVISDCLYEEEKTWAGTDQISIKKNIFALISKENFWQCNPNYREITELGGAADND